jgi:hypothetical protein
MLLQRFYSLILHNPGVQIGIVENMDWTGLDWTDFYIFSILDLHVTRYVRWHGTKEYFITEKIYHVMSIL